MGPTLARSLADGEYTFFLCMNKYIIKSPTNNPIIVNTIAVTTTLMETAASNRLPSDRLAQLQLQLHGAAVGGSSGGDSGAVQFIGGAACVIELYKNIHYYIYNQELKLTSCGSGCG